MLGWLGSPKILGLVLPVIESMGREGSSGSQVVQGKHEYTEGTAKRLATGFEHQGMVKHGSSILLPSSMNETKDHRKECTDGSRGICENTQSVITCYPVPNKENPPKNIGDTFIEYWVCEIHGVAAGQSLEVIDIEDGIFSMSADDFEVNEPWPKDLLEAYPKLKVSLSENT